MVSGGINGFSRFQVGFSWFQVGFYGFSRFQVRSSWFQVGFEVKSWLQVCFYSYRSVFIVTSRFFYGSRWFFMLFMAPGLVFIFPGGFLLSLMVPGWFKSELSAAGAK